MRNIATLLLQAPRFPKPDFESGYQYPNILYPVPNEMLWDVIDVIMLVLLMSIVAWAALKKHSRKPIFWVSIISIGYFGFFRSGCICSVGSIQNIALALADTSYVLPITVFLIFILPIAFTLLFGRVYCGGVCPFGALQEIVNVKNGKIPRPIAEALSIVPWIYLIFALLYAATRSRFIICQFDPFVSIFRLGGDAGMILFGVVLLIASMFTGRPFCRFLCPYGAILSLFSNVSIYKTKLTHNQCINCSLCHNSCLVDAVRPPYDNKVKESRETGTQRVLLYLIIIPVFAVAGAFIMRHFSYDLSRANKDVKLYDMVMAYEANPTNEMDFELEAFYGQGGSIDELTAIYNEIEHRFSFLSTIAGILIGLVIGLKLLNLSLKRTRVEYEIDNAACVSCGRCFSYCPQNIVRQEEIEKQI